MTCANHPDREKNAFCQNCGKPLCHECTRIVGTAVFCEPCLAARLSGVGAPPAAGTGDAGYSSTYPVDGTVPPSHTSEPNPGLAALLGFIPGVGAMYNGQYAKGVVHLVVFAILISLANENGIFGLFIAGWVCYQIIEAHHTARARRDGTPLPNPFGLNDLGERLGFGKAWPGTPHTAPPADAGTPPVTPPPAAGYATYSQPYTSPYTPPASAAWNWENYVPPANPYTAGSPADPNIPYTRNRFPAGAIWLIGLGLIFLVGNAGIFRGFPVHRLIPFFLIGLGIWLFIHKMTTSGGGLADDGTPLYRVRLLSSLRGSVWVVLVGVLFLLASFDILSWSHSWPLFIIVGGLMSIMERTAYNRSVPPYPYSPPQAAPPPATTSTSIVPSTTHDQEGK